MKTILISIITLGLYLVAPTAYAQESRPSYNTSTGFFVKNGTLYDGNGCAFVPRGVNNGHAWYDHANGDSRAYESLDNIAGLGFNAVRVVWAINYWSGGPTSDDNVLRRIIERCIALNMVPVVELHDYTGDNNPSNVRTAANWWAARASLINDYEEHIIVNILNEWGNGSTTDEQWRDAYQGAITTIRNAGIKATLLIDATEWAKNISPVRTYGSEVLNHDPQKNIAFSTHYYCGSGESSNTISDELGWAARTNEICLMVGEFAQEHYNYGTGGICDTQEQTIVAEAQKNGQGYFWWAWNNTGDGGVNFSLGDSWEASQRGQLTDIGEWLILDSPHGIAATSQPAGIFSGDNCSASNPPSEEDTTATGSSGIIIIRARSSTGSEQMSLLVAGQVVQSWTVATTATDYAYSDYEGGEVTLRFDNDGNDATGADRNLAVDYVEVCGQRYEAEQANRDIACGPTEQGSVWLWCNSSLRFGSVGCSNNARRTSGGKRSEPPGPGDTGWLRAYPNPAAEQLTVTGGRGYRVAVYDLMGRPVMQHEHLRGQQTLDISHLRPGVYVIKMSDGLHPERQQRVVVE